MKDKKDRFHGMINMRVKIIYGLSLLISVIYISGCSQEQDDPLFNQEPVPQLVNIDDIEEFSAPFESMDLKEESSSIDNSVLPKIEVGNEWNILKIVNFNLDFDAMEEQVLILKRKDSPSSKLHIVTADFDNVRGDYKKTWESDCGAEVFRSFNLFFDDIIGDHNLEIVCSGLNEKGEQTLDLFRKSHSPSGVGLYFTNICAITSDGRIEIEEQERTQAYKLRRKNGISYPIIAYSHDPDSENILDLIKVTYYWQHQQNAYEPGKTEKILGKKIEERKLAELFTEDETGFENFLSGPWFKKTNVEEENDIASMDIISFNPRERRIILYSGSIQEVYIWESSHKTRIANSLYINTNNELIPYIGKQISVFIDSLDTIHLQMKDGDVKTNTSGWDGEYQKLTRELQISFRQEREKEKDTLLATDLTGPYKNDLGWQLIFEFPKFSLVRGGKEIRGGYSLYQLEDYYILELIILDKSGLVSDTESYKIAYTQQVGETTITHICTLTPGIVTVYGFRENQEDPLRFEQIEILETEESESTQNQGKP